jgi:NAD(P)-dependent dehydrogenase (short-subunit alcohol dehydrogenase family)
MKLAGLVAVVAVPGGASLVRRLTGEGATVVLTGDSDEAGRLLAEVGDGPGRVAYFHGDADSDVFVEFVAEQFTERPPVS